MPLLEVLKPTYLPLPLGQLHSGGQLPNKKLKYRLKTIIYPMRASI